MSRRPGRWRSILLTTAIALGLAGVATVATPSPAPAQAQTAANAAYVMTYFRESPNGSGNSNNVHLAVSKDGLQWTPLNDNKPILDPDKGTGGIRDPYLYKLRDGSWVLVATDLAPGVNFGRANPNIHIWTSRDLVNWSADRLISINSANPASYTWAPAIHWDASRNQYGITFSANPAGGPNGSILVSYTSDFQTFTPAVKFFDNNGAGGVIDSAVIPNVNGQNYLYYRGPNNRGLFGARSSTLAPGSFTTYTQAPPAPGCVEAPTVVQSLSNPSNWMLWGDNYCPNNKMELWQGNITQGNWTLTSKRDFTAPLGSKHNDVKPITQTEYDALLAKYGGSASVRLKSWNFPERYVRHAAFAARIDPLPFDPQADSQFKQVTGLAGGTNAVSFESVNFPGRYLRNVGGEVRLVADDGTAQFDRDATFTRVAGLADGNFSSFRSVTDPNQYLRHSSFQLRVTTIPNATAQADATFAVVN